MNINKPIITSAILACLLNIGQSLAQTAGTDAYESSFRKSLLEVINSSCGNPPSVACVNNSNEVKNTVRQVCGAFQGQDRARCVEIANETASKAITSSIAVSPNQSASQPSPQSRVSQAKSEEAREIEAIEQKIKADELIRQQRAKEFQEQKQRDALKWNQSVEENRRLNAEKEANNKRFAEQQMQERYAKEQEQKATRDKLAEEQRIAKEKVQKEIMSRTVAGIQRGFYQNMINGLCEMGWSALKNSKEYVSAQAVRKSSSRELCACTKENLPKAPFVMDYPFERIEKSMNKGKYVDMSLENQQIYDILVSSIAGTYEACSVSVAQRGN